MINVIVIAGFIVAIVALWTKMKQNGLERDAYMGVNQQMMKGAEHAARREVKRKDMIRLLQADNAELSDSYALLSHEKQVSDLNYKALLQDNKEAWDQREVLEKKARQLEQALKMEQQERAKLEDSLKYYMELLGEQMNTGALKPMNDDISRYALRACLADALDRNAKLRRLIRRMRDRGRFPQIPQIDPQITLISSTQRKAEEKPRKAEVDGEFESLRAGGPTTAIIQGDDAWEAKHEAEIPEGEVAVAKLIAGMVPAGNSGFPADGADKSADYAEKEGVHTDSADYTDKKEGT